MKVYVLSTQIVNRVLDEDRTHITIYSTFEKAEKALIEHSQRAMSLYEGMSFAFGVGDSIKLYSTPDGDHQCNYTIYCKEVI